MATKTFKVSLSLDNPRIIQTGIKVRSFDKQSIKIAIELTKNSQVYQIPTGAQIKISLLKLARQEQKIILDVPFTSADSIDWVVPDYLDGYQGEVRIGVYLIVGTENIDVGYFNITSSVSDIDSAAEEFTESVLQGWAIEDLTALLPKFQAVLDETTGKDVISAPEIILARNGEVDLKTRLDKEKQEVTAQLAHNRSKTAGIVAVETYRDYAIKDENEKIIDWSPAINKAIVDGGTNSEILLPNGDVPFSQTIFLTNRVKMSGYGMGESSGNLKAGTLLIKTSNVVGISVRGRYTTLEDFSMTSNAEDDTSAGIELGGDTSSYTLDSATSSTVQNVSVFEQGGDGIWMKNADGCKIEVITKRNNGHGLRMHSTNTTGDNVNGNMVTLKQSTGNMKSGLFLERAHVNFIVACCEGNTEYGIVINSRGNTIEGYTEGNLLGSAKFGLSSGGNHVTARFNEGSPTYVNHNNYVTEKLPDETKIKNIGAPRYSKGISSNRLTLKFPEIAPQGTADMTIPNVYLAVVGDPVYVSPDGPINAGLSFYGWVSADSTVSVRITNHTDTPITPLARTWRAEIVLRNGTW